MISAIILAAGLSKRMKLGNKLLLEKNNNPGLYYKDDNGDCAFLHSCRNSNLEIVGLLLRKKNIKAKNNYNENALITSIKNNNNVIKTNL